MLLACSAQVEGDEIDSHEAAIQAVASNAIVEGEEVPIGEFPGAAAIYWDGDFTCGGVLVHPEWVITAAHCDADPEMTTVGFGEDRSEHQPVGVSEVFSHPDQEFVVRQDIAVIRLREPAPVTPVPIVAEGFDVSGQMGTAWGFGRTERDGPASQRLLAIERPIESFQVCRRLMSDQPAFDETLLCQITMPFSESTCSGDSGGPLTIEVPDAELGTKRLLAGLIEGGTGERCGGDPGGSINFYGALAHPKNHEFLVQHLPSDSFDSGLSEEPAPMEPEPEPEPEPAPADPPPDDPAAPDPPDDSEASPDPSASPVAPPIEPAPATPVEPAPIPAPPASAEPVLPGEGDDSTIVHESSAGIETGGCSVQAASSASRPGLLHWLTLLAGALWGLRRRR